MKGILLRVPTAIKVKLDRKRSEGYTVNGFINAILARELAGPPPAQRKGRRATP